MAASWEALSVLPTLVVIFAAPSAQHYLSKQPTCVNDGRDDHLRRKLRAGGALATAAALDMIVSSWSDSTIQLLPFLRLLGAFYLTWVLYFDHKHSASPSPLISWFLGFEASSAAVFCLPTLAPMLTSVTHFANSTLATFILVARVYLLILHERSKWDILKRGTAAMLDREATYGFWSRCLSISLLQQINWSPGGDNPTVININRMLPPFIESLRFRKFGTAWDRHAGSSIRLLWACVSALEQECIVALIATICTIPFKLAVPFWVENIIRYAQHRAMTASSDCVTNTTETAPTAPLLSTAVVLLGFPISRACSRYAVSILKLGLRSTTAEVVFGKLQKRSGADIAQHVKLSIVSEDMPAVEEAAELFLQHSASIIEVLISIYYVRQQSNVIAGLWVVHVAVLALLLRSQTLSYAAAALEASEHSEKRSDAMTTILLSIRGAKALGCTMLLEQNIRKLRSAEKDAYKTSRKAYIIPATLHITLNVCALVYIFAGNFFSSQPIISGPDMFKCSLLLITFFNATMPLLADIPRFSKLRGSMMRLQSLLQKASYEMDARYTTAQDRSPSFAVRFNKATLCPEPEVEPLLKNVNISFTRGTLTIIIGDEKRRALLQAAIANCTISQGIVEISGKAISYCGSDAWVQRRSVKENIIGGGHFNESWYRRVVQACCLEETIGHLPGGNEHIVETSSKRLDPSQLQRLALARSVYSGADIIVLDDVLNYQDAATSATIRHNLFFHGGLLRNDTTTVLLATEDWQPFVDMGAEFVSVDNNGQVSKTSRASLLARLAAEATLATQADVNVTKQLKSDMLAGSANQLMIRDLLSNIRNETPIATKMEGAPLSQYLGRDGVLLFSLAVAGMIALLALENVECFLMLDWIRSNKPAARSYLAIGILCAILAGPVSTICNWLVTMSIGQERGDAVHERLTATVFKAPYGFFQSDNVDSAIRLLCEGFSHINYETHRHMFYAVYHSLVFVTAVLLSTYPSPFAPVFILLGGAFIYAFYAIQYPVWHALTQLETQARFIFQKHFIETATGSAYIRAMGWETAHSTQTQRYIDYYQQTGSRVDSLQRWTLLFNDVFRDLWITICIAISLYYSMDPCRLGLSLYLAFCMSRNIGRLIGYANSLRNDLCLFKEMENFIVTTPQEEKLVEAKGPPLRESHVRGDIQLREVSVGYKLAEESVLSDVNLRIPSGLRLGVQGQGECGKSAFFLALCGVLPYAGSITVDGREVRNMSPIQLADIFTVVPETPMVIPGATVLQMLFPPELSKPGRLKTHMPTIELLIHRLGLEDMIKQVGGFHGKFEDLYLTSDQMYVFALARGLVKFTFHRNAVFLMDDIMSKVSLETYNLMSDLMISLFGPATNTVILLFRNHLFPMLEPTRFARIENGRVQELDLANAPDNMQ